MRDGIGIWNGRLGIGVRGRAKITSKMSSVSPFFAKLRLRCECKGVKVRGFEFVLGMNLCHVLVVGSGEVENPDDLRAAQANMTPLSVARKGACVREREWACARARVAHLLTEATWMATRRGPCMARWLAVEFIALPCFFVL